ncbi:unnamed protein product [Closterium sp. NIES-54]
MALDGGGAEHRGGGKDGGGWECLSPGARGRVANMGPGGRLAREAVEALLTTHCQTFAYTLKELGCCNYAIMTLNLTTTVPVYQRRRRMSPQDLEVCREKCLELLEAGLIRRSESSYAVATVVAARMDLAGTVLSRRMSEGDKAKTAFHGPDGAYEWNRMPFWPKNAPLLFQKVMDAVLRGMTGALCYIDDVIVYSATAEEHVERLAEMLRRIKEAGLTFHPKKCRFGHTSVTYLGFEVAGGKVAIQKAKVAVLDCVAQPKDKSALRALLGFLKYYRKFVENFSKRAAPLNRLLREDLKWNRAAFERSKAELQPLLVVGLGYRWSLDLASELPLTKWGRRYMVVMIEYVSKWVEVLALSNKTAVAVAEVFEEQVLTRFGACGEVLSDQGTEFQGEFDEMLASCLILHRTTSRYHPQSDVLTERLIQTLKRGLRAYGETQKRD